MEQIIPNLLDPEENYAVIDAALTDLIEKSGGQIEGEAIPALLQLDRVIKVALGLPVDVTH